MEILLFTAFKRKFTKAQRFMAGALPFQRSLPTPARLPPLYLHDFRSGRRRRAMTHCPALPPRRTSGNTSALAAQARDWALAGSGGGGSGVGLGRTEHSPLRRARWRSAAAAGRRPGRRSLSRPRRGLGERGGPACSRRRQWVPGGAFPTRPDSELGRGAPGSAPVPRSPVPRSPEGIGVPGRNTVSGFSPLLLKGFRTPLPAQGPPAPPPPFPESTAAPWCIQVRGVTPARRLPSVPVPSCPERVLPARGPVAATLSGRVVLSKRGLSHVPSRTTGVSGFKTAADSVFGEYTGEKTCELKTVGPLLTI